MQQRVEQFLTHDPLDNGFAGSQRRLPTPSPIPSAPVRPVAVPALGPTTTSPALWGLLGFVIGAVFWHFIGFWGFVSDVVFNGPAPLEARYIEQTGPRCIELVFDRTAGVTRGQSCAVDAPLLDERSVSVKDEFQGRRGKVARGGPAIRLSAGDR